MLTQRSPAPLVVDAGLARCVVDYALARRAALTGWRTGRVRRSEVCDASPDLRRSARYHGRPSTAPCPICEVERLVYLTFAYGEHFPRGGNGRARGPRELIELAGQLPEFSVYAVEVCLGCGWNHLMTSYVLGTGEPAGRPRRQSSQAVTPRS